MVRLLIGLLLMLVSMPALGADRYLSPTGDDSKLCLQAAPCKSLTRVLHVRQAGESIHFAAGVYAIPNLESVPLVADGDVQISLPTGNVPIAQFVIWSPPPSGADVQIGLKAGGPITRAQWIERFKPIGLAYCYVDKGTKVEVVK